MACEKEEVTTDDKSEKPKSEKKYQTRSGVGAGDFVYGDGWLGWLDPELVDEDIEISEDEIWKGEKKWYGYEMEEINGIVCPEDGGNCGRLYTYNDQGIETAIGVYLEEDVKGGTKGSGLIAGDFVYGDGWLGWLDPELVDEDIEISEDQIWKGEAIWSGWRTENPKGIVCPEDGENCGRLYTYNDQGLEIPVGLYLVE